MMRIAYMNAKHHIMSGNAAPIRKDLVVLLIGLIGDSTMPLFVEL